MFTEENTVEQLLIDTPEEILEELKEKADILVEHLEGFALLLPRLCFKA